MYIPAAFTDHDPARCRALIAAHPLATLVVNGPDGAPPEAQHVPLLFLPGDDDAAPGRLLGHVARANPLARVPPGTPVLAVFHGPGHPISPAWYASKAADPRTVPTWNYATVHATGRLTVQADRAAVLGAVARLTDAMETRLGSPWRLADAPAEYVERLCAAIVAVEIALDTVHGKWKLSQNRTDADRASVVAALERRAGGDANASDDAFSAAAMARWMRDAQG